MHKKANHEDTIAAVGFAHGAVLMADVLMVADDK